MNLSNKTLLIAALLLSGIGYGVGRYLQPSEVRTEVREVVKEVEVVKKDVVTIIKEKKNTDGSVETVTTITDKTTIDKERDEAREEIKSVINLRPQWRVQGSVGASKISDLASPIYGVGIEKRILGPVSAGIYGRSDKELGLTISLEF